MIFFLLSITFVVVTLLTLTLYYCITLLLLALKRLKRGFKDGGVKKCVLKFAKLEFLSRFLAIYNNYKLLLKLFFIYGLYCKKFYYMISACFLRLIIFV